MMSRAPAWLRAAGVIVLVGGAAVAGSSTGPVPTVAWFEGHPLAAFGVMAGTGLLDGINPGAIAALLLFIGALLAGAAMAASSVTVVTNANRLRYFRAKSFSEPARTATSAKESLA